MKDALKTTQRRKLPRWILSFSLELQYFKIYKGKSPEVYASQAVKNGTKQIWWDSFPQHFFKLENGEFSAIRKVGHDDIDRMNEANSVMRELPFDIELVGTTWLISAAKDSKTLKRWLKIKKGNYFEDTDHAAIGEMLGYPAFARKYFTDSGLEIHGRIFARIPKLGIYFAIDQSQIPELKAFIYEKGLAESDAWITWMDKKFGFQFYRAKQLNKFTK